MIVIDVEYQTEKEGRKKKKKKKKKKEQIFAEDTTSNGRK